MTNPSFFDCTFNGDAVSLLTSHDSEKTAMRPEILKIMLGAVARTLPDEIGCDECFALLDQFTELILAGKPGAEMMPLVHAHLERCADCKDEFEAFLIALRSVP